MRLFHILLLIFLLVPIVEIYLLIEIGSRIGAAFTVFLVVLTAVLGAALIRHQGLSTIRRIQQCTERGELPAVPMVEGMLLLIAGALLLTPGFFTDTLGFLVVIPPLRQELARNIIRAGIFRVMSQGPQTPPSHKDHPSKRRPETLEGEFHREDD